MRQLPSRGAAHAMWADLPADLVQLQSNGGETGTTFLRHRPQHVLTPRRLTELYLGSDADDDSPAPRGMLPAIARSAPPTNRPAAATSRTMPRT